MINIMCFGDSNTFGYLPTIGRFGKNKRWPGVLQNLLGDSYNVIEEGLNGRATVFNTDEEPEKNGYNSLSYILPSKHPLDYVIIMLGTNDTKFYFNASMDEIVLGLEKIINYILKYPYRFQNIPPKIILVSPILINEKTIFNDSFDISSANKSKQFDSYFSKLAKKYDLLYLDAAKHAKPSDVDGVHLDEIGHKSLAEAIYKLIT